MTRMISYCSACSSQNFVSAERKAVGEIPPRCWNCGAQLPTEDETPSGGDESKKGPENDNTGGGGENG